jgi:hypothetical protein
MEAGYMVVLCAHSKRARLTFGRLTTILPRMERGRPIPPGERIVSIVILLVLAATGASILQVHRVATRNPAGDPAVAEGTTLAAFLPPELVIMSPPESFDAATLSDKINGKADLYLSAGFQHLDCQRFHLADDPDAWLETFLYDMGEARNAFAVYSGQRRSNARPAGVARLAYETATAVFLAHGPYYVELVSSREEETLRAAMLTYAGQLVDGLDVAGVEMPEIVLFPEDGLVPGTVTLYATDAFGFDRFDNVFAAEYSLAGERVLAFVSLRETAAEARELAEAYDAFLRRNGAQPVELAEPVADAYAAALFEFHEIVFARDNVLAGVHEAEDVARATELAVRLAHHIEQREVQSEH